MATFSDRMVRILSSILFGVLTEHQLLARLLWFMNLLSLLKLFRSNVTL